MSNPIYQFVFLHGWGGTMQSLLPLAKSVNDLYLARQISGHEFVQLELPGFGETNLDKVYTLEDYGRWLQAEFAKLPLQGKATSRILVGHSVGGKVLLELATKGLLPKADRLILISASGLQPRNSLKVKLFKLLTLPYAPVRWLLNRLGLQSLRDLLQKAFYKYVVRARDYEKLTDKPLLRATFQNIIRTHIDPRQLGNIANPTLLIWGALDGVTPLWMGEKLATGIASSRMLVIADGKHGVPLTHPTEVAGMIVNWLADTE